MQNLLLIGTIMKVEYISKMAWSKILTFLKNIKSIRIGKEENCKMFLESIYWLAKTGAQWREIPEQYGKWNSIFKRFNSWSRKQVWQGLLDFCVQDPDLEYIMIDSTIIRAHACAAGYGNQEAEGLGRSKGGFTSKIHAKVDALGNPLQFVITAGQRNDITQADILLKDIADCYIIADRGYHSNALRDNLIQRNCQPVIPPKINSRTHYEYDKHIYKERHVIECFFSKIKYFRRIFSRFDKSARNFLAFLSFVGVFIWLR